MKLDEFEKIVRQSVPLAEEICLHLMGEPLAHPQFLEILKICSDYKAQIQLTTNGLLIKRYQEVLMSYKNIRQINFSVQSFRENYPDKDLKEYLTPILNFIEKSQPQRPELYFNLRLWNQNSKEEDNSEVFDYLENYFNLKINRNIEVGAVKSKKIWNRLYLHFDSRFEWPSLKDPIKSTKGRCHGLINHIGILANGTLVPCCLDDKGSIPLGNCKEQPIKEILNNERATAIRKGFLNGILVEDLCQRCTYIERFR
tara:strand:+ start:2196 stop:2963 length:768 start_codon:yes stop_codon:yes gene_type:complete